jgi:hypothetical protein
MLAGDCRASRVVAKFPRDESFPPAAIIKPAHLAKAPGTGGEIPKDKEFPSAADDGEGCVQSAATGPKRRSPILRDRRVKFGHLTHDARQFDCAEAVQPSPCSISAMRSSAVMMARD